MSFILNVNSNAKCPNSPLAHGASSDTHFFRNYLSGEIVIGLKRKPT